jgi:glutamate-1-semialdehyde 2,1-aminomutase
MGVVPPKSGFLKAIRELTTQKSIVLILDEVITGFRFNYGGYQAIAAIEPDLTCLGKIIGGGLPVGAFGGRRDIMERLAPSGTVYQAGTLSGNPLAMAAGMATLAALRESAEYYELLDRKTFSLCDDMKAIFDRKGLPIRINRVGSMFTLFFTGKEVVDFASAATSDTGLFARYFAGMLKHGINIAPSQFEASFLSFAHTDEDFEKTLDACDKTLKSL